MVMLNCICFFRKTDDPWLGLRFACQKLTIIKVIIIIIIIIIINKITLNTKQNYNRPQIRHRRIVGLVTQFLQQYGRDLEPRWLSSRVAVRYESTA